MMSLLRLARLLLPALVLVTGLSAGTAGYYRFPAIHGDTIVFTAEGDLWQASAAGGTAHRLTTHPALEILPAISPDGKWVAFTGQYEGPQEVYVMPLTGGLPRRLTWEGEAALVRGWTPDGRVLYATRHYATLPSSQLVAIHPESGERTFIPLAQADEAAFGADGRTLYFTRYSFQGSHAKRYEGGTAQNLWRLDPGADAAVQYHPEYKGVSRWPMFSAGRVYFASERDGTSNLWSMKPDGSDLRQHTKHADFGVKSPQHHGGRIVYQNGADLWILDTRDGRNERLALTLASDFDQTRETWVDKPAEQITGFALSPTGDRLALVARGRIFVAPASGPGRLVEATRASDVRYRSVEFASDGKSLVVLSDQSGEVEFWRLPANGIGAAQPITRGAETLRMSGLLSPDGKWIASAERDQELWIFNAETGEGVLVDKSRHRDFDGASLDWSPDSRWLAYVRTAPSGNPVIFLYDRETKQTVAATSDRVESSEPAFSPDGKWLYFLSERNFNSLVGSPWGSRQPEPFLDRTVKIYQLALGRETRSPFQAPDELSADEAKAGAKKPADATDDKPAKKDEEQPDKPAEPEGDEPAKPDAPKEDAAPAKAGGKAAPARPARPTKVKVEVVTEGLTERLWEVPVPAGNYNNLSVAAGTLFVLDRDATALPPTGPGPSPGSNRLVAIAIKNRDIETTTVLAGMSTYRLSADGKKLLIRQGENFLVIDAAARPAGDVSKARVSLAGMRFSYTPRETWRQMYTDAWRLHRDYFYDAKMHGVDWKANHAKHLPLVDRVTDRYELNDVLAYLISELSALHSTATTGDFRDVPPRVDVASLGARWTRDVAAGGYRLERVYRADPDFLERRGPLQRPGVGIAEGDVIVAINGTPTLSVPDAAALLRDEAGRQVLLRVKPAAGGDEFSRIVTPLAPMAAADLRYADWQYSRRTTVDKLSGGKLGYVHLRAMGTENFHEFVRQYYAASDKAGLILDLRHNRGGNIDSWLLARLMRQPWMWWAPRDSDAQPNMQFAFRGHLVVLVDAWTASDGETMANGVRRLGLGKSIGVRTWGGGIWLRSGVTALVDRGFATAAEMGSYIPGEGWTVEGPGFTPDIIVDNNPVAAFRGEDTQLAAAVKHLQELVAKDPKHLAPPIPPYPDVTPKKR